VLEEVVLAAVGPDAPGEGVVVVDAEAASLRSRRELRGGCGRPRPPEIDDEPLG
jgi:hypothetical protein